jgi:DNA protecting protein DprA
MDTPGQPCDRHRPVESAAAVPTLPQLCDHHAQEERVALLALLAERPALAGQTGGETSWPAIAAEVALHGSAVRLWDDLHADTLTSSDDIALREAATMLQRWHADGFTPVTVLDADYPVMLRSITQLPPLLFLDGNPVPTQPGVAIVGSRAATQRGRSIAGHLARSLVQQGISVISGLADGIDTAAHQGTLEAGGHPIGVLGTGIDRVYPAGAASAELHRQVATAGTLISQFWPGALPARHHFPLRNITISGLGHAAIIVEAGEHSGTRSLARAALDHGRPIILTDLVADGTDWGRALASRPGVHVAAGTADVLAALGQILAGDSSENLSLATASAPQDGT